MQTQSKKQKISYSPVIIFGDSITALGVINGLKSLNIDIYIVSDDGSGIATRSKHVKGILNLDIKEDNYVEKIISWINMNFTDKPTLMIAGNDDALIMLSKEYDLIYDVAIPTFPSWNTVNLIINKELINKFAEERDIPVIKTNRIDSAEELDKFFFDNQDLSFPIFLKCVYSRQFSKKFKTKGVICHSKSEVYAAYKKFDGFMNALLLQDYIPGDIDQLSAVLLVLDKDSKVIAAAANNKIRSSHLYGPTTLSSSMWNQKMVQDAVLLAESIGYKGFVGVQFKYDERDNTYKFLEINGRFSVSVSLAQRCGINMSKLVYKDFNGLAYNRFSVIEQTYEDNILLWMPFSDLRLLFQKRFYRKPIYYLSALLGNGYIIEPFKLTDIRPLTFFIRTNIAKIFSRLRK